MLRARFTMLLALVSLTASPAVGAATARDLSSAGSRDQETPAGRDRRLHAEQIKALRTRAAEAAERSASDLDEAAQSLERALGGDHPEAKAARKNAKAARERADVARRRANAASAVVRRLDPEEDVLSDEQIAQARVRLAGESDKHAAAARTAEQNKKAYLPKKRVKRSLSRTRIEETLTYSPGEAPDMGDLDIYAEWQWGVNVARGDAPFGAGAGRGLRKTGDVDVARVSFQPNPKKMAARGMKWGMRRFNLGDVTVVDCDFTGIPKEHGIYDSLSGHGLYRGNTFTKLGGQALQIVYRDQPQAQYQADNLPLRGRPTIVVEDNHAVDTGLDAGRSGFTWTFFDPGTHEYPGTVIFRNNTAVQAWDFTRTTGGQRVSADHPEALRCPGGLVLHQYQQVRPHAKTQATETLVIDNCLFDFTMSDKPLVVVRGVGTILIEDSCFLARDHRGPYVDVDDIEDRPSGKVIIENCVSPEGMEVWLRIRQQRVLSMHCPGKRFEIDVATLEVTELEPVDDPITRLISPLEGRRVRPGIHPQPRGHVDDMGTVAPRFRPAPKQTDR